MPTVTSGKTGERSPGAGERTRQTPHTPPTPSAVSENQRYEPRFRVVVRKPLPSASSTSARWATRRAMLLGAFPAICLLVYVIFWTLTARGAFYRDQLQSEIQSLRVEQGELQAERRRLQSPGLILGRARDELGMQPAAMRDFARLPVPEHVAQNSRLSP